MEVRRIRGFTGAVPTLDRTLIAENAAQQAANVFLTSGRLDAIPLPKPIIEISKSNPKTIYRMFNNTKSFWLSWDEQVDVAESPVFVENDFRIAFTSPSFEPRQTNLSLASSSVDPGVYPVSWYVLGVTPPITAPTVTSVTGGSGTNVSRTYVYTFANQWGEESAPSPASPVFSGLPNGTWNVSIPDNAPSNSYNVTAAAYVSGRLRLTLNTVFGLRAKETITLSGVSPISLNSSYRIDAVDVANKFVFINMDNPGAVTLTTAAATRNAPHNTVGLTKRVYRSVTTAEGSSFFLVGSDIPAATTTFADAATIIGEELETLGWGMPPADLEGVVTHSSGSIVGFRGNEVYISEPYAPYAFKVANIQVIDFQIVALGAFGQSIIIGTVGRPYLLSFVSPETATPQKLDQHWPCVSKRGMISYNGGVYYPTTVGLAFIGNGGAVLVTDKYYSQQDWTAVKPETFIAGHFDNRYFAIFTIEGVSQVLVISDESGVSLINDKFTAMYPDRATGDLYVATDKFIKKLYGDETRLMPYAWMSKEFIAANPVNLGAAKIDLSVKLDPNLLQKIEAENAAILASNLANRATPDGTLVFVPLNTFPVNYSGIKEFLPTDTLLYSTFTLLINNEPVFSKTTTSSEVFRLPSGKKYDRYAVQLSGTAPVSSVLVGETPLSLKQV